MGKALRDRILKTLCSPQALPSLRSTRWCAATKTGPAPGASGCCSPGACWRRSPPGGLTEASIAKVLEDLGHARDDKAASDLAADRYGFGHATGAWLADALLAERLGWVHAVPLLGTGNGLSSGRSRRPAAAFPVTGLDTDADRTKNLLAAVARAAPRAIDLSAGLGRRADRLLAIAPKFRAKGADAVVGRLLNEDALGASRGDETTGMSDRGLRLLFDRLVELGALRELSGRPTFRICGL